ncbi:MAG: DUF1638 domain-containing protein [Chloroflexi bacterium]|nr:DUF1638 domain-containing protein [Chloroflexota bacterium]
MTSTAPNPASSSSGAPETVAPSSHGDARRSSKILRIKALACEVLARQVYLAAAQSPHAVDVEMLEKGLHDNADTLRSELQRRIDAVPETRYDAVVLVYGLCNRATEGLLAQRVPLVLARAHDCITLYLGSRQRYAEQFDAHPGTYYFSAEWLERGAASGLAAAGAAADEGMAYGSRLPSKFETLVRQYGEDNARYLMEVMGSWRQHYTRAAYIGQPCTRCDLVSACSHDAPYHARVRAAAERNGWQYVELDGDSNLVARLLEGSWDEEDIIVVPAGSTIVATFDERVVRAGNPD